MLTNSQRINRVFFPDNFLELKFQILSVISNDWTIWTWDRRLVHGLIHFAICLLLVGKYGFNLYLNLCFLSSKSYGMNALSSICNVIALTWRKHLCMCVHRTNAEIFVRKIHKIYHFIELFAFQLVIGQLIFVLILSLGLHDYIEGVLAFYHLYNCSCWIYSIRNNNNVHVDYASYGCIMKMWQSSPHSNC